MRLVEGEGVEGVRGSHMHSCCYTVHASVTQQGGPVTSDVHGGRAESAHTQCPPALPMENKIPARRPSTLTSQCVGLARCGRRRLPIGAGQESRRWPGFSREQGGHVAAVSLQVSRTLGHLDPAWLSKAACASRRGLHVELGAACRGEGPSGSTWGSCGHGALHTQVICLSSIFLGLGASS